MTENSTQNPEPQKKVKGRWLAVTAMGISLIIDGNEGGIISGLFPMIRDAFGLSVSNLGILSTMAMVEGMIFGPLWAWIADRVGRKTILVWITGFWGVWTAVAGFSQNYTQLLILYAIGAIGTVASTPIIYSLISDLFESEEVGRAFGIFRFVISIASVIMTPLIGQFANIPVNGWRIGLYVMGGFSVLTGILMWIFVKDPRDSKTNQVSQPKSTKRISLDEVKQLLKIPTIRLMIPAMFLISMMVLFAYATTFLVDERGFTIQKANVLLGIHMLGFTISSLIGGFLGDFFERKNPKNGRVVLMIIYLAVYSGMSTLGLQITYPSELFYFVVWFLWGLAASIGYTGVVLPMVAKVVPSKIRSTAYALLQNIAQALGLALFVFIAGKIADATAIATALFFTISVPYLLNIVIWTLLLKTYPKDKERLQESI
jgi:predicted MFS family arabinose efflux permease